MAYLRRNKIDSPTPSKHILFPIRGTGIPTSADAISIISSSLFLRPSLNVEDKMSITPFSADCSAIQYVKELGGTVNFFPISFRILRKGKHNISYFKILYDIYSPFGTFLCYLLSPRVVKISIQEFYFYIEFRHISIKNNVSRIPIFIIIIGKFLLYRNTINMKDVHIIYIMMVARHTVFEMPHILPRIIIVASIMRNISVKNNNSTISG